MYNDGYSNRAFCLAMAGAVGAAGVLASQQPQAVFTETSTNNYVATDALVVGNTTLHMVTTIGTTAGNVLIGASFAASNANIRDALAAAAIGGPATANYVPAAAVPNVYAVPGTGKITYFYNGATPATVNSTYTAAGTAAGSFGASTFAATAAANSQTREVDFTVGLGLSIQFEIVNPIVTPAVFEVWSDIPSTSNPCVASGIAGNQVRMQDTDLCTPTNPNIPMVVTIGVSGSVTANNIQGFAQTEAINNVGAFIQGRPRCPGPGKFMFVKGVAGDVGNVNISLLVSRLKYTSA